MEIYASEGKTEAKIWEHILNILEQLGMVTSGDSDDKILLFNSNGPHEPNRILFLENPLTKNISYEENYLINKVKCVTENDNHKM